MATTIATRNRRTESSEGCSDDRTLKIENQDPRHGCEPTHQKKLPTPPIPPSILLITFIAWCNNLRIAFHVQDIFLELRRIDLHNFVTADDPDRLEFRPS